jgi:hypothetical protein
MSIDYTSLYKSAQAELLTLREEKAELERTIANRDAQMAALIQTMNAIAPLVGEKPVNDPSIVETENPPAGMTGCIRTILSKAGEPLSASEIRDKLESIGFDMKSYSNPLATIHTILRRLTESSQVEAHYEMDSTAPGGKKFAIAVGKDIVIERVAGKTFQIGKMKGLIGVGKITRRRAEHD